MRKSHQVSILKTRDPFNLDSEQKNSDKKSDLGHYYFRHYLITHFRISPRPKLTFSHVNHKSKSSTLKPVIFPESRQKETDENSQEIILKVNSHRLIRLVKMT